MIFNVYFSQSASLNLIFHKVIVIWANLCENWVPHHVAIDLVLWTLHECNSFFAYYDIWIQSNSLSFFHLTWISSHIYVRCTIDKLLSSLKLFIIKLSSTNTNLLHAITDFIWCVIFEITIVLFTNTFIVFTYLLLEIFHFRKVWSVCLVKLIICDYRGCLYFRTFNIEFALLRNCHITRRSKFCFWLYCSSNRKNTLCFTKSTANKLWPLANRLCLRFDIA